MTRPLEGIAFLSRSRNRVDVLEALDTDAMTRQEVRVATDVSRTTLGRVLREFEERNWVARDGDQYATTPLGELVVESFLSLRETMRCVATLREVVDWLPTDEMDVDLGHFADADVTFPDANNPAAHQARGLELLTSATTLRVLVDAAFPQLVAGTRDRVADGTLSFEGVLSADLVTYLDTNPELAGLFADLAAAGEVHQHDGPVPYNMLVADETLLLWLCDADQKNQALLTSDDAAVVAWAEETFESYRAQADELERGVLQ